MFVTLRQKSLRQKLGLAIVGVSYLAYAVMLGHFVHGHGRDKAFALAGLFFGAAVYASKRRSTAFGLLLAGITLIFGLLNWYGLVADRHLARASRGLFVVREARQRDCREK